MTLVSSTQLPLTGGTSPVRPVLHPFPVWHQGSDFSRPLSATDSEGTEFPFDWNRVMDVDPDDPWLQTSRLQNDDRDSGHNHPTRLPDVVVPVMRRCPRANITSWRSCNCAFCSGPASWWEWGLMLFHCLAIVGLWRVLIFSVVQLFREGAHIRQSDPVTVVPEQES